MLFAAVLSVVTSALAAYVAALNHRFARAPGWRDLRWFTVVALSITGFAALNLPIALSGSDRVVLVAARFQLLCGAVHSAAWLLYARAHLRMAPRAWERALVFGIVALGAAGLVPGAVYAPPVRRTMFAPLQLPYAVPTTTLLGDVLLVGCAAALALVTVRYAIAWRRRSPHALTHFAALAAFFAFVTNDALVAMGVYHGPFLVDIGILLPVAAVGYSLTARFAEDARALEDLRQRLESLVDERTRELSQAQDALHRAEKLAALGQLSTGVAHEVNNPAAVVSANLKYLGESLDDGELPPDARDCIRESLTSVDRISAIVRQLLDAGRLAASKVPLEPVSLARCAREAVAMARTRVPDRVTVGLTVDDGLVALGRDGVVVQVLVNLIVNGAQAVPDGRRGHVSIRGERVAGGRVRVLVEDDGVGMDDEVLRRVFEPFFSTKAPGVGTGLGLAVSRGLVAGLGGRLDLESVVGRGTRATIDLAAAEAAAQRPREAPSAAPSGPRRRLLLLDDEPAILRALTRILEPYYAVLAAGSVEEALAVADLRRPDVLLCDVVMPDGGGEALYRALAEQSRDLVPRVIFLTGGAANDAVRAFLAAQPQPVLAKPLDLVALARVVERLAPAGAGAAAPDA